MRKGETLTLQKKKKKKKKKTRLFVFYAKTQLFFENILLLDTTVYVVVE